jgi:hypothetical protein
MNISAKFDSNLFCGFRKKDENVIYKITILIDNTTPVKYKITTFIDKTIPVKYKITALIDNTTPVKNKITTFIENTTVKYKIAGRKADHPARLCNL